jgi:hypothetical protein
VVSRGARAEADRLYPGWAHGPFDRSEHRVLGAPEPIYRPPPRPKRVTYDHRVYASYQADELLAFLSGEQDLYTRGKEL